MSVEVGQSGSSAAALQARVRRLLGSRAEMEASRALLSTLVAAEAAPGRGVVALELNPSSSTEGFGSGGSLADLRRTLRTSLEDKQLALAETALKGLGDTLVRLSSLRESVDALDHKCAQIQSFLDTTKRETQQVQTEAAALAQKTDEVQREWQAARAFLARYQLAEDEVQALYAKEVADEDMETFFATLERVRQVKSDCKALVAAGDVNCALELLDSIGKYQEAGFERLYQWTARKCAEVEAEPSNQLHRAIALLRDRTEFYSYCKECITASRRSLNVRRFIVALTRGGPNGIPRPIEMHAHDPVRYCGDMLAWVHQAIATDTEFFRVLFDGDMEYAASLLSPPLPSQEDTAAVKTTVDADGNEDGATSGCTSMVGRAFDGVARPLQVRIEQTLASQHGLVIAYKLVHLLAFYHHTFDRLVAHSLVAVALSHCRGTANGAFLRQLQMVVDSIAASAQDYSTNLSATHATMDVSQRLVALLEVSQSSLLPDEEKEADLSPLFDGLLPALGRLCDRSVQGLDAVDALVFRINNFSCLHVPLKRFPETAKWLQQVERDLDLWLRDVSELLATRVLDRCNVSSLLRHIQRFQTESAPLGESSPWQLQGLDGETISTVMEDFCGAVVSLSFPQVDQIAQPDLSDKARQLTASKLAATYAFVYEFVHDGQHGYHASHAAASQAQAVLGGTHVLLHHTPDDVRTMLELDAA